MKQKINNKDLDTLSLTLSFPGLGCGSSSNSDSALIRPYLRLLKYGNPTGKINYLFYKSKECTYVLGSLTLSPMEHLLFFPGIIGSRVILETSNKAKIGKIKNIDHLILNNSFNGWHITIGQRHSSMLPIKKIRDNFYYWFSLSILSEEIKNYFEILPSNLKVGFEIPTTDAKRRMNDIIEAREKAIFHILQLPDKAISKGDTFVTFEFFIGKHFFRAAPYYGSSNEKVNKIVTRIHHVYLELFNESIWIRTSEHKGNLQQPCIVSYTKN